MKKEKFLVPAYKPRDTFRMGNTITDGIFMIKLDVIHDLRKKPDWAKNALLNPDKGEGKTDVWLDIRLLHALPDELPATLSKRVQIGEAQAFGMLMGEKAYATIQYGFYRFFKELFPYCDFHVQTDQLPIIVKHLGNEVALFMPMYKSSINYDWMIDDPSVSYTKELIGVA